MTLGGRGGARVGGARRPPEHDVLGPDDDCVGGRRVLVGCSLPPAPVLFLKGLESTSLLPSDESADSSQSSPCFGPSLLSGTLLLPLMNTPVMRFLFQSFLIISYHLTPKLLSETQE